MRRLPIQRNGHLAIPLGYSEAAVGRRGPASVDPTEPSANSSAETEAPGVLEYLGTQ